VLRVAALGLTLVLAVWIGAGLVVVALAGPIQPAGRFVDIGGRKLRLVCAGPATSPKPTIWMEAGAWGLAADFSALQQRLAEQGLRSCAYDRAGLGFSDPGPRPRDSRAIAADLERLMTASGEKGPFVLMAHSMAGLHIRLFAGEHPDKVAGLVLLEAATPEMSRSPRARKFLSRFRLIARAVAAANTLGLSRIAYWNGDRIGLPPQGAAEKRRAYVSGRHARVAAQELLLWSIDSDQAARVAFDPRWPVAVVTAGDPARFGGLADPRRAPADASHAGYFENDPSAGHANLLGLDHSDAVLRGVAHVMAALPDNVSRR